MSKIMKRQLFKYCLGILECLCCLLDFNPIGPLSLFKHPTPTGNSIVGHLPYISKLLTDGVLNQLRAGVRSHGQSSCPKLSTWSVAQRFKVSFTEVQLHGNSYSERCLMAWTYSERCLLAWTARAKLIVVYISSCLCQCFIRRAPRALKHWGEARRGTGFVPHKAEEKRTTQRRRLGAKGVLKCRGARCSPCAPLCFFPLIESSAFIWVVKHVRLCRG